MTPKNTIRTLLLSSLIGILLAPSLAQAWWNGDWASRNQIKIDATPSGVDIKQNLEQVPVLVRLHTGNFTFADAKEDGSDLRFVAGDDKTELKYHIERFDPLNELAFIWVMLPKVTAASKAESFWMYYGNDKAVASEDKGIYDASQLVVFHFEGKDGFRDATAFGNHATAQGVALQTGSIMGSGAAFDGKSRLVVPATPANTIAAGKGFSFQAWVKSAAAQDAVLFARRGSAGGVEIGLDANGVYAKLGSGAEARSTAPLAPSAWHHVAVTVADTLTLYLDGKAVASVPAPAPALDGEMVIGADAVGAHFFRGEMDEVQAAAIARSADWIKAAAEGQGQAAKLISYGEGEATDSGNSYFGTILHSVTLDGWVVIGILMVMAAISWAVMIGKGIVIRRMANDNTKFMASFKSLANDPGALDTEEGEASKAGDASSLALFGTHDHYQHSPIFRIYHVGVQEIKHRFGGTDPVKLHGASLTPQAIDAIRASLDATLVRENQKLNSQMVLLTIAISGGPFLGLLGTVVGVMITFAAIAASGDVNVNAIAPGIAAALVATVAGLAVAIPALFGYNYLGSQIKDITADMQVFVDEFICKVAEHYHA